MGVLRGLFLDISSQSVAEIFTLSREGMGVLRGLFLDISSQSVAEILLIPLHSDPKKKEKNKLARRTTCVLFWFRHRKLYSIGCFEGQIIHIHAEPAYVRQVFNQSERFGDAASVPRALLYIEETSIVETS